MGKPHQADGPPHVLDQAPIDLPPFAYRSHVIRRLRKAAAWFRERKGVPEKDAAVGKVYEQVAHLVIDAHAHGLIPPDQRELIDLIRWHTEPDENKPVGMDAMENRCPYNLFLGIRGGGAVLVKWPHKGAGPLREIPGSEHGGLIPRMFPEHLNQPQSERDADTCDLIADMVESTAVAPPPPGQSDGVGEPLPAGLASYCQSRLLCSEDFSVVKRTADGAEFTLTPTQRKVIEHMVLKANRGLNRFTNNELFRKSGSEASSEQVRDIFVVKSAKRSAWGQLIEPDDEAGKGWFRLRLD